MKKYAVVSFVFILSLILLGFNANSANAMPNDFECVNGVYSITGKPCIPTGCSTGDLFSRTTGRSCGVTTESAGCKKGDLFSSLTGQSCSTNTTTYTGYIFTKDLSAKLKSRGDDVLALQQFLKDAGYLFGKVDGKFGKITGRAVGDFQEDNDLTRTEIVDAATRIVLNTTSIPNPPEYYNPMSPVISEVIGPESLDVNQTGIWTVKASSISGGNLSYSVNWGDEYLYAANTNAANQMSASQQSATFTHNYSQAGTYKPVFMASNSATSTQKQVSVVVSIESTQLLVITTTSLSRGAVALSYFANISATGGTGEYNWSLSSGSLPVGLSLLKSQCLSYPCKAPAVIDGIPIKAGTYNFTIKVISGLQYYTKNFTLTVNPVDIFPVSPVISGVSGPQTLNINQTGTWSVKASNSNGGNLSYGVVWGDETYASLLLDPNSGKRPIMQQSATFTHSYLQPGNYTPTFTVTNSSEQSVKTSLSVTVQDIVTPTQTLSITTTSSLGNAQVGVNYSNYISANEGINPNNWYLVGTPVFPPGLIPSLSSELCNLERCKMIISGTPTVAGTYNFTVGVVYGSQVTTKQFTLTVDPTVSVSSVTADITATPAGGGYYLAWTSTNATSCSSSGDGASWGWPSARYISGGQYTPTITSPQTFTITCTSLSGSATKSVTVGSVLGAESFNFTQFLSEGSQGNEVLELQKFLNGAGYDTGTADGKFGPKTKTALIKFQIANNLKSDGIVGFEVRSLLNK